MTIHLQETTDFEYVAKQTRPIICLLTVKLFFYLPGNNELYVSKLASKMYNVIVCFWFDSVKTLE